MAEDTLKDLAERYAGLDGLSLMVRKEQIDELLDIMFEVTEAARGLIGDERMSEFWNLVREYQ